MKYYVAFANESFKEAIGNHCGDFYESEEDAVLDTIIHLELGDEFFVVTSGLATLSRYQVKLVDKKKVAVRVTEDSDKNMRREAHELNSKEVLFELYTALKNQKDGGVSIMVRNKMELARQKLGL